MDDKERMIYGLKTVEQQFISEIASDEHSIKELLRDPSISPPAEGEPVSYAVHKVFHHLGTHKVALTAVQNMITELESS